MRNKIAQPWRRAHGVNLVPEPSETTVPERTSDSKLEKRYFKLLQAVHHAEVIERVQRTHVFPIGMSRQVNKLTSFIKPSSPNVQTTARVKQNTDTWIRGNMNILKDHYDLVIAEGLQDMPSFEQAALEKAIAYGKNRYKSRLTTTSIATLTTLVDNRVQDTMGLVEENTLFDPAFFEEHWPELRSVPGPRENGASRPEPNLNISIDSRPGLHFNPNPGPNKGPKPNPNPNHSRPDPLPNPNSNCSPDPEPNSNPEPNPNPNPEPNPNPSPNSEFNPNLSPNPEPYPIPNPNPNPLLKPNPLTSGKNRPGVTPLGLELRNRFQTCIAEIHPALPTHNLNGSLSFQPNFELNLSEDLNVGGTSEGEEVLSGEREEMAPESNVAVILSESQFRVEEEVELPSGRGTSSNLDDDMVEIRVPRFGKPTRHRNTYQKMVQWRVEIKQPILIIGDSNLSRIPKIEHPLIQIDSFPGAQILHLKQILGKLDPCLRVQKVLLSIGLNNCLRKNKLATIQGQFRQLMSRARDIFPRAEIWIPRIQISTQLPLEVQTLVREVNLFLEDNFRTLGGIEEDQFQVNERDLIHWTAGTSTKIMHNWMSQLNFK